MDNYDLIALLGGAVLTTHGPAACAGRHCVIHNPSAHHMVDWPLHWRDDRGLMERLCRHGVGHPDVDHLDYIRRTRGDESASYEGIHGCDGCCARVNNQQRPRQVDS